MTTFVGTTEYLAPEVLKQKVCCSVLQCVAVCCFAPGVLKQKVCCSVFQCVSVCCRVLLGSRIAQAKGVLQVVELCCRVLQCVAVCCSVMLGIRSARISANPTPMQCKGYRCEWIRCV